MKEINKKDVLVITNILEPFYEVFEDVVASKDGDSPAERQAWLDWATDYIATALDWTPDMARKQILKLERLQRNGGY